MTRAIACWGVAVFAVAALASYAPAAPPDSVMGIALPDSTLATLHVETLPDSLEVMVDEKPAGRSPLTIQYPARRVRVRAVPRDPWRFEARLEDVEVKLEPGARVSVLLDARPSIVVRSDPEPVRVLLTGRSGGPDSLLGETPLRLRPGPTERASIRLIREGYADTVLSGASLVAGPSPVRVALKSSGLSLHPPGPIPRPPLYRKRWLQWTLVGVGAALSGAAIVFHREGNEWYERYLASSDVDEIPDLYDRAVRYDRLAAGSLAVGQGCLLGGLFLLLTTQSR